MLFIDIARQFVTIFLDGKNIREVQTSSTKKQPRPQTARLPAAASCHTPHQLLVPAKI
jgi:hypothetical protein